MAALTTKRRKALPASDFAGPGRTYPVDTKARAANAKARAKQQLDAGNLPKSTYSRIVAKANKVLGKK